MDLTLKIVRRLLRDQDVGFSRNQNFEAYDDPAVRRAVRIFRHLRSIEQDLLNADINHVSLEAVEHTENRVVLKLSFPRGESKRESYLSSDEWNLLIENERVSDILSMLHERASDPTRHSLSELKLA